MITCNNKSIQLINDNNKNEGNIMDNKKNNQEHNNASGDSLLTNDRALPSGPSLLPPNGSTSYNEEISLDDIIDTLTKEINKSKLNLIFDQRKVLQFIEATPFQTMLTQYFSSDAYKKLPNEPRFVGTQVFKFATENVGQKAPDLPFYKKAFTQAYDQSAHCVSNNSSMFQNVAEPHAQNDAIALKK